MEFHHDRRSIYRIMLVQFRLKITIVSFVNFFSRLQILDTHFYVAHFTFPFVMKIFGTFQRQNSSGLSSNSITVSVVFGQYFLSLSASISMIKRDNRLLDGCFGKFKQLAMSSIFNSNAELWPKNQPKNLKIFIKDMFPYV